jgi:hypothetical protein
MKEYSRKYPLFSLCGLNCGLCPSYQSNSKSACPGCGGKDFCLKHPTCPVVTCNRKHDNVEYCFECSLYPCEKYKTPNNKDSFITYQKVKHNFDKCCHIGIGEYQKELNKKVNILEELLEKYNNGRLKSFFCLAVNLLELDDLEEIMEDINKKIENKDIELSEKIKLVVALFETKAQGKNIVLKLRK